MNVAVEGTLARNAEVRLWGGTSPEYTVFYLIDGGHGLAFEVRDRVGPTQADAVEAERRASRALKGMRLRATGRNIRCRLDHDVAAVVLLELESVTTI